MANLSHVKAGAEASVLVAQNADEIDHAQTVGSAYLAKNHQPAKQTLEQRRADNLATINDLFQEVLLRINADQTLTEEKRAEEVEKLEAAKDECAVQLSNEKLDAQGLLAAFTQGQQAILASHRPGERLVQQKQDAKNALLYEREKQRAAVQEQAALSLEEQELSESRLDRFLAAGQAKIDEQGNAQGIQEVLKTARQSIDTAVLSAKISLADRLQAAQATIQLLQQQTATAIQGEKTLLADEKEQELATLAAVVDRLEQRMSGQNLEAEAVIDLLSTAKNELPNCYRQGNSLANQRWAALVMLARAYQREREAVRLDRALLASEQVRNQQAIAQVKAEADKALQAADTADVIQELTDKFLAAFKDCQQPAVQALSERQKKAANALSRLYDKAKNRLVEKRGKQC
ncbi:hypothetical protein LNP00_02190 [Fructobacillus sp. M158]|uniref:hypothetical protein n=1 Tax=Fructobacillus parabroussonetiae TaxID=2713174 RepID=UPI00200A78EB|nr:hypothetical protein [Fructobacillus parabroussonetiae]MCK8617179.1 hypothetical protein [Fructobacillus parabroussonetiae]